MLETTTKYKDTPIGKIPVDWEVKKLGDLGSIISGLTYSPENVSEVNGVLVLRSSNVQDRQLVFDDNVFVNVLNGNFNPVQKNDILICVRNGSKNLIGKNALITKEIEGVAFGAFMAIFRSDLNNFLFQIFGTDLYKKEIHKNLGATINSINGSELKQFKIPLPPLPEQQKIAEVLSTWDKAIKETSSIIKSLEKRNKALALSLFQNKEWSNNQIKDLFVRITDKNVENNKTVTTISAKRGFIRQEDFFNKTVASEVLTNYYLIDRGDFCYNKSYSKGYDWGVVKRLNDFDKAVVTTLYICFRLAASNQNSDFWELYFSSGILDRGLSKVAHEGGRAHGLLNVTSGDFFSLKVAVPSLKEQTKIAEILKTANNELQQYQQKLNNLKTQKKGLMQQLLTGKVRTV